MRIFYIVFLIVAIPAFSQSSGFKNQITGGISFFDRGIIGINYSRMYNLKPQMTFSFGGGLGLGGELIGGNIGSLPGIDPVTHLQSHFETLYGRQHVKFILEVQPKILLKSFNTKKKTELEAFSPSIYLGFISIEESGTIVQLRLGINRLFFTDLDRENYSLPTIGLSIGKAF